MDQSAHPPIHSTSAAWTTATEVTRTATDTAVAAATDAEEATGTAPPSSLQTLAARVC